MKLRFLLLALIASSFAACGESEPAAGGGDKGGDPGAGGGDAGGGEKKPSAYAFTVFVDGQKPMDMTSLDKDFAMASREVGQDSEVVVDAPAGKLTVTFVEIDYNGVPVEGFEPVTKTVESGTSFKLDDGGELAPEDYMMEIVHDTAGTSRVKIEIAKPTAVAQPEAIEGVDQSTPAGVVAALAAAADSGEFGSLKALLPKLQSRQSAVGKLEDLASQTPEFQAKFKELFSGATIPGEPMIDADRAKVDLSTGKQIELIQLRGRWFVYKLPSAHFN